MIDAVVIQLNSHSYAFCGGKTMRVPCGDDQQYSGDFWAKPVTSGGVWQGWEFVGRIDNTAPTPDSFKVTRVIDKQTSNIYYVLGTLAQLDASCADDGVTPMPLATTIPVVVAPYKVCANDAGNYIWNFVAPDKAGSDEYRAYVSLNNTQGTAAASAGHASIAAMVTWLNTEYSAAGTWSNPSGNIIRLTSTSDHTVGVTFTVGNYA